MRKVWGTSSDDVWVIGVQYEIEHWDGAAWTKTLPPGNPLFIPGAIAGSSASNVWLYMQSLSSGFGQSGQLDRYDGATWQTIPVPMTSIGGLWVDSPTDAWVSGDHGTFRWDGVQWSSVSSETDGGVIWGSGPSDVWVGGSGARLHHWDGSAWSDLDRPSSGSPVTAITGPSASDVWLVVRGTDTHAFHWNGTAWSPADTAAGTGVSGIWAQSPTNAYGVSTDAIVHWDGAAWTSIGKGTVGVTGIWGSGPHDIWALGGTEGVLHHD